MAKMLYSVTMSLDGFIAGPGADMSWLTDHLGPNPVVDDLIGEVGALLVGANTYRGDDPHKNDEGAGKAFGGGWEGPQYVVTHHPPAESAPGVFFRTDVATALADAEAAAGDRYVNVLGADLARQCLEAGRLDEVLTFVAPVLLGDGTRLFHHPGGRTVQLERVHHSAVPHATALWFKVLSSAG
ncbi:bifunctional deaminase-reductase domain protein [Kribbella flavida DSM 17836]|uniref:Bifunctional deaminase-reductase domain protein n=1 Tax=Kribbella flavida (strain DSM 17836 / JCM 10339 / NBRC 14399) TaxID=479435 RepID=D2PQB0_KRIFD|nr:dihydrofolate reductase family protein [Kribbella flavida]ADB34812.1 bifunctional deaminase-reductase domain protein [Kribbella flavida DSM 17836]